MSDSEYSDAIDGLRDALHLAREYEDWAIIVSDPKRVDEFIQFYQEHPELSPLAKRMLFELIIASISDAMQESRDNLAPFAKYVDFVRREASAFPGVMGDWSTLDHSGEDWFNIAPWLRQITGRAWERTFRWPD